MHARSIVEKEETSVSWEFQKPPSKSTEPAKTSYSAPSLSEEFHGRKIWHTWNESENLMATKVDATAVVTHFLPMSRYEEAFDALISGKAVKVLIDPQN